VISEKRQVTERAFKLTLQAKLLLPSVGFVEFCINGIELNRAQINEYLNYSLMFVMALNQHISYDKTLKIKRNAHK
jgi:fumarate hydratase class II